MNGLALDIALIGLPNKGPLQEERALREAQIHAIATGSANRWELRRSVLQKPRWNFQRSPSP
jgi:hypothetical protein